MVVLKAQWGKNGPRDFKMAMLIVLGLRGSVRQMWVTELPVTYQTVD